MLSSSDAESVAVSDLLALEPDAAERLFALRLGYTESPGGPELRAAVAPIYETATPEDVVVVAAAEEGIFTAYHALLELRRPRRRRDTVLRVGAAGGPVGRRRGDRVAAHRGRRLGARSRRARARAAARYEARLSQCAAQPHRDPDVEGRPRRASSSSAPSAAPGSSATRSTASSSTIPPTGCLPPATCTSGRCPSARCRRPTGSPACASAGSPRGTARRCSGSSTSSTTRRSARAPRASCSAHWPSGTAGRSPTVIVGSCSRTCRSSTASSSATRTLALLGAADGEPDRLRAR